MLFVEKVVWEPLWLPLSASIVEKQRSSSSWSDKQLITLLIVEMQTQLMSAE